MVVGSREFLASGSKGTGAELVRGGLLEDQKAGKAGAELLEGRWLESQEAGKPRALLLEGGWVEDQQERGVEDQLQVAGAYQLAGHDNYASRHGSALQAWGLRGASLAERRHSLVHHQRLLLYERSQRLRLQLPVLPNNHR